MKKSFEHWATRFSEKGQRVIQYPSETLVRMLKGNYIPNMSKDYEGKKVLEVGFAYGANLQFLMRLGLQIYGVEVHQEICDRTGERLADMNIKSVLEVGSNREIPFPDRMFDYLVSWDTIHYETSEKDIQAGIGEFGRVLKPGGRLFLSTVAPGHTILMEAEKIDRHRYRIKEETFRKNEIFFCLDSPDFVKTCFLIPSPSALSMFRMARTIFLKSWGSMEALWSGPSIS